MADFVGLGFDLAFKYRNPAIILADGIVGQMMEKVVLPPFKPRRTDEEVRKECPWGTMGKTDDRERNIITSLALEADVMEATNHRLQAKYRKIEKHEVRFEAHNVEDADYVFVAFGSAARLCGNAMEALRAEGIKVGLLRPITLWPFPTKEIERLAQKVKGFMSIELSAGQMVEDVRLAVNGKVPVEFHGRMGGNIPSAEEIMEKFKEKFKLN